MKDPINLPPHRLRTFVCIDVLTGHIRNEKEMSAEMAVRINNLNHMTDSVYKWLWNDQNDFNDQLNYNSAVIIEA